MNYLAQQGIEPVNRLVDYGILGVILAVLIFGSIFGYIWFKPAVDELKVRLKQSDATNDRLINSYESEAIPALVEAIQAIKGVTQVLEEQARSHRGVIDRIDEEHRTNQELLRTLARIEHLASRILMAVQ